MKKGALRRILSSIVCLLVSTCALHVKGDEIVYVELFGISPNPVYITEGDAVLWFDGDDFGPYTIYSSSGAWPPLETPGYVIFDEAGTYNYFTDVGDTGTVYVSPNLPPSVTITNPATNAVFTAPATFTIQADAFDVDSGIYDVEFYIGTNEIDDVFFEPWETTVTNLPAGNYTLTAVATDNSFLGLTATNSISITVLNPTPIVLSRPAYALGQFNFSATGLTAGKTNLLQRATDIPPLAIWTSIQTNVAASSSNFYSVPISGPGKFYFRVLQMP